MVTTCVQPGEGRAPDLGQVLRGHGALVGGPREAARAAAAAAAAAAPGLRAGAPAAERAARRLALRGRRAAAAGGARAPAPAEGRRGGGRGVAAHVRLQRVRVARRPLAGRRVAHAPAQGDARTSSERQSLVRQLGRAGRRTQDKLLAARKLHWRVTGLEQRLSAVSCWEHSSHYYGDPGGKAGHGAQRRAGTSGRGRRRRAACPGGRPGRGRARAARPGAGGTRRALRWPGACRAGGPPRAGSRGWGCPRGPAECPPHGRLLTAHTRRAASPSFGSRFLPSSSYNKTSVHVRLHMIPTCLVTSL